jgi:hypothetical protein
MTELSAFITPFNWITRFIPEFVLPKQHADILVFDSLLFAELTLPNAF